MKPLDVMRLGELQPLIFWQPQLLKATPFLPFS